jgi:hypothetical protein
MTNFNMQESQVQITIGRDSRTICNRSSFNSWKLNLLQNPNPSKGLMSSDAALVADPHTARYVTEYSQNTDAFFNRFTAAMLKLGRVGVKLGSDGEVRRICSAVN